MENFGVIHKIEIPSARRRAGFGWIYILYLEGEIVYVGQTIKMHPLCRIGEHAQDKAFNGYSFFEVEIEALSFEELRLIKEINPMYNKAGKDGYTPFQRSFVSQYTAEVVIKKESDERFSRSEAVSFFSAYCQKVNRPISTRERDFLYRNLNKFFVAAKQSGMKPYAKASILSNFEKIYNSLMSATLRYNNATTTNRTKQGQIQKQPEK